MKFQILSKAVALALLLALAAPPAAAQVATPTPAPLLQKIQEAKTALEPVQLNYSLTPHYKTTVKARTKTKETTLTHYSLDSKDIALAILNPDTGDIKVIKGLQQGSDFQFADPSLSIKKVRFNGVNSHFDVTSPDHYKVIALKYLITPLESGAKTGIESSLYPAIYVPYSADLKDPEVVAAGKQYLNTLLATVASSLKNVPSSSAPGKTITEAIPIGIIKALIYAEHTTAVSLRDATIGSLDTMNILLAANGSNTYKYSVSNAAARGIAQFIPATYESLVKRHPDLGFISDFKTGMEDHTNSIKAMYVLLDDYAGAVRKISDNNFLESRLYEYGAAAYNGGVTRIAKSLKNYGDAWNQNRSSEIAPLESQLNTLTSQLNTAKAKLKNKKLNKKTKAALKNEVTRLQNRMDEAQDKLDTVKSATLRNETINYLNKIYSVIHLLNADHEDLAAASL